MKKKYSKPKSEVFCVTTAKMIASSPLIPYSSDKVNNSYEALDKDDTAGDEQNGLW